MGFIVKGGTGGSGTGTGGTTDHNALTNKNLPNQHTIDAITGLLDELGKRPQTADVNAMINSIIDGAPEAYNTLKEIADYIAQDQSAGASILAALGNKVDKEAGKGLSSNDYTNIDKSKVHDHANSGVLGKIGEDENGNIIYNNNHVNDKLANARTIEISGKVIGAATSFDGSSNITIPVTSVIADSCTGNSATANKLKNPVSINGIPFDGSANIDIPTGGVADGAITTAKMADGAVSADKIKNGAVDSTKLAQTLLDLISQGGSGGANSLGYFSRDIPFYASDKLTIATPNRLWVNIAKNGYMLETQKTFNISADASWDSAATLWQANHDYAVNDVVYPSTTKTGYYYRCTTSGRSSTLAPTFPTTLGATCNDGNVVWVCELDFTVAANRKGKDFYIYSCIPANGTEPILVLSANSTVPLRYTADTSRKIGGFHTLCADVGTITGHTLSDYVAGDIIPNSAWDLKHRPKSDPEGMAYIEGIDLWVDIYLTSWTGSYSNTPENLKLVSRYGAVTADGTSSPEKFHWFKSSQLFSRQKKRMLWQHEFIAASIGSNQGKNVVGGKDVNTTGGFSDTAGRRMVSNFGLEDCCGNLWQWGMDSGTGGSSYASAFDVNDKYVAGQYTGVNKVLIGGSADDGAVCGSRASNWLNGSLYLAWNCGSRGASEPLRWAY